MEIQRSTWPCQWPSAETTLPADGDCPRLAGHDPGWMASLADGFGHRIYLLEAKDGATVTGVLPLVFVKGPLFGRFLVSLPYLNTGGVWAASHSVATRLIDHACELADELDVKYLELRHELPVEHEKFNLVRTDKKHLRLSLPATDEELEKSFKSKLRSQIRKAGEHELNVSFAGMSLLDEFYAVFARNMRDLGTPVFSKSLFRAIIEHFEGDAEFCAVSKAGQTIASGLLVHRRGCSEVPSASCLREFNRTNANMLMYRHLLRRAIERSSHTFDFGRSSEGSGTFKFKTQWGAKPFPACWQYYVRHGDPNDMRPDSGGNQRLIQTWQRLPVWVTRCIGPSIVRGIP
ncbi:FemAB family XrtA/PEP-CTERM system-associated protein [Allorhodopirellula solitaria]|uniref:FemAB family protein n=1 Tax=Allorhodopirellula solitaria TaxID=2527987 RepID=A0A5C5X267_9BACT|nr:FemAB family XrtA/PEP-CTERM system-associated protein [Allorhodopirellula solitaria]TWT56255.1 FemAB family protein [Allorhodopirellula solitaria]